MLPYLGRAVPARAPDVLKRMKRPASGEEPQAAGRWRGICPEMVVRSHLHRRLPGETEAEFEHLLEFIREASIDRAGCFAYSPVEGAAANQLPGLLSAEAARGAPRPLHGGGRRSVDAQARRRVGATMQVLIDHAPGARPPAAGWGAVMPTTPEIDGRDAPAAAAGEGVEDPQGRRFTRARIVRPKAD